MLALVFKKGEYVVFTCNSIDSFFKCLQSTIPNLLILDVMHTELNKGMICDDLRKRNALKTIPILITSTRPAHIRNYKNFCADDGIEKPFTLNELMGKVNSLVSTVKVG